MQQNSDSTKDEGKENPAPLRKENKKIEETPWIESEWLQQNAGSSNLDGEADEGCRDQTVDDCEEPEMMTDWFLDPDPMETFAFQWNVGEKSIDIKLQGYKAELGQTLHSTGLTLWRASNILCDFMVNHREEIISRKNILELGAGLGLCGILASQLGANCVILTDGDTDTLARMRENVEKNSPSYRANDILCYQLIWGTGVEKFQEVLGHATDGDVSSFDLILGSDIIYVEEILEPLWNTVDALLTKDGAFWLAYARRNVSIDLVLHQAEKQGFEWTIPEEAEGVFIFTRVK